MRTSIINKAVSGLISKLPEKSAKLPKQMPQHIIQDGKNQAQKAMYDQFNVAIQALNSDTFQSMDKKQQKDMSNLLFQMLMTPKH